MSADDWRYVTEMAKREHVTLREAGVKRTDRLGHAMDKILVVVDARSNT